VLQHFALVECLLQQVASFLLLDGLVDYLTHALFASFDLLNEYINSLLVLTLVLRQLLLHHSIVFFGLLLQMRDVALQTFGLFC